MVSTFGDTTIHGGDLLTDLVMNGNPFLCSFSGMVGSQLCGYFRSHLTAKWGQMGIYNKSDGSLIGETGSFQISVGSNWYSQSLTTQVPLISGATYTLAGMGSGETYMRYDIISKKIHTQGSQWIFPNPATFTSGVTGDISIYAICDLPWSPSIAFSQLLSESFTMGDGTRKAGSYWEMQAFSIIDYFNRIYLGSRILPGDFSVVDSLIKSGSFWKGDSFAVADAIRKTSSPNKVETLGVVDYFDRTWEAYKTRTEGFSIVDTTPKGISKTLIDKRMS